MEARLSCSRATLRIMAKVFPAPGPARTSGTVTWNPRKTPFCYSPPAFSDTAKSRKAKEPYGAYASTNGPG